jgi:Domain of unknown function (DUF4274)
LAPLKIEEVMMALSSEKIAVIQSLADEVEEPVRSRMVGAIGTAEELQYLAEYYNWDDGFELPTAIANHSRCDLGTALTLFWLASAESWRTTARSDYNRDWWDFCELMYVRIKDGRYEKGETRYQPRLGAGGIWSYSKSDLPGVFFGDIHDAVIELRAMARNGKDLTKMVEFVRGKLELENETAPLLAIFCQAFSLPLKVVTPLSKWVSSHDEGEVESLRIGLRHWTDGH